jgi:hypothetical protein
MVRESVDNGAILPALGSGHACLAGQEEGWGGVEAMSDLVASVVALLPDLPVLVVSRHGEVLLRTRQALVIFVATADSPSEEKLRLLAATG